MAKVRVYELAKDLNMTNKALLNKMEALKIEVKSHMSTLEDSTVVAIKRSMPRKKRQKKEVKAKPVVIRRRRQKVEEIIEGKPAVAEPGKEEIETEASVPKKTEKQKPVAKKSSPKAEKEVEEIAPETIVEKTDAAVEPQPEKETPAESVKVAEESDRAEEKDKKAKKRKKKKKSTPAKIVKTADPSVLENIRKSGSGEDKQQRSTPAEPQKEVAAKKQRGKAKKAGKPKSQIPVMDISLPADIDRSAGGKRKKKKQRKRKAVIEGDALYGSRRDKKRRGKKDARGKKGQFQKTQITIPKAIKRRIKIDEAVELSELAKRMGIKANEMIAKLMTLGVMATVNQTIDFDTATLVASEFDFEVEKATFEEEALLNIENRDDDEDKMIGRAPVVTIMGHVDHGKTSLLDVIRKSKITSGEAGGITQHIGAYNVETPNGGRIAFLDTPGHAAFTAMRSRGAKITDIVILVVAADDGVMPQTIEAINHSKAANVPVVVAVNKMDKAGADPDRIMRELSEFDLLAEEWGGDVIFVKVSAKTGQGIDALLEMVLLQSEVLELKANPDRKATGYVVESRLDTGRGTVATVLVKQGTLRDGDAIVCGLHSGRIRAMIDYSGERIAEAGPSTPAEIIGLNGVPDAGDEFIAVASDKDAKQIAGHRMQKQRAKELAKKSRVNLEKMFENLGTAAVKELKLVVKADVQGSIEALNDSLKDLAKEEVDVKIVHSGTGTINETDVGLASVSDAIIVGFNVRPTPQIRRLAKDENVDMRFYNIIYDVINDIKAALDGLMPSTFHEIIIGRADVRDTFVVPKMGTIAGCHIAEGKVVRGKKIRLLRDGVIKCDTKLSSLRRFKEDVKEVEQGYECGIGLEKYNDIKIGDVIECYEVEERKYKAE